MRRRLLAALLAVSVGAACSSGQEPEIAQPQLLFDLKPIVATSGWGFIDPVADGQFVAVGAAPWESETEGIEVVVNWGDQVAEKLGARTP